MPDEKVCCECGNASALPGSNLCEFCTDEVVDQELMASEVAPVLFPRTSTLMAEKMGLILP